MNSTGMELPLIDVPSRPMPHARQQKPIKTFPDHLYLEPTSVCNLKCTMCYTNVINGPDRRTLSYELVTDFVERYMDAVGPVVKVYWCGTGEAFLHKDFPRMVNRLLEHGANIEQTIQTNGTINRLDEFQSVKGMTFNVSIDGPKEAHERHRGPNTFERTIRFCRDALDRGCRTIHIRCLLRRDNIERLDEFQELLTDALGPRFDIELNPPFDNAVLRPVRDQAEVISRHDIDDSPTISRAEALRICAERYHGKFQICDEESVDNYVSLLTYGVFTCCNGIVKIGEAGDPVPMLLERMLASQPDCAACALFPCQ